MTGPETSPEPTPAIRVTKGDPTADELAALVVVLGMQQAAGDAGRAAAPARRAEGWASHRRSLRTPLHPGPGAWQAATRNHLG